MNEVRHVVLFRHGETDYNASNRFQGHLDVPLNEAGREQARRLVPALAARGVEAIVASDLSRARETGEIVASALSLPLCLDARLREAHLGEAQGLTRDEIVARFGSDLVQRWRSGHVTDADISFPGGESGLSVRARAFAALEEWLGGTAHRRVGVATHGGVIRRVMGALLPPGAPPVPIPNGVVYDLELDVARRAWRVREEAAVGG